MGNKTVTDAFAETQPITQVSQRKPFWQKPIARIIIMLLVAAPVAGIAVYLLTRPPAPVNKYEIRFLDVQESQQIPIEDFSALEFSTSDGAKQKLSEISDAKFTVLVITRGWSQSLCLYCVAQTAQWAAHRKELEKLDAKLVLIFPVASAEDAQNVDLLRERVKAEGAVIDFPIMLDIDLVTVDRLGIRAQLSKPATYIIDQGGKVRFAYVGQSIADRPSVESVLNQLKLSRSHDARN